MKNIDKTVLVILISTLFFITLCSCDSEEIVEEKLQVGVLIEPYRYFVEKIAEDRITVSVLVPQGSDPHFFTPTPKEIEIFSKTKLYFKVGGESVFPVEELLINSIGATTSMEVIDLRQGVTQRKMKILDDHHAEYDHHSENDNYDPHIWLGLDAVAVQLESICNALSELDPAGREFYEENLTSFLMRIDDMRVEINEKLKAMPNRKVFVYHPAFGYLFDSFTIEQIAIESEGKSPTPAELRSIINLARDQSITTIFIEPQFSKDGVQIIADAIAGKVVELDPLAYEWESNINRVVESILSSTFD